MTRLQSSAPCLLLTAFLAALLTGPACSQDPRQPPAPTRAPGPRWILAGEASASEWLVYASPTYIHSIALDGDRIWAASDAGLLCWDRATGDLTQYLAPQTPLPGNHVWDVLLHDDRLYVAACGGVAIFDRRDRWMVFRAPDMGLPDDPANALDAWFTCLAMDGDVLWVGGSDGLARLSPDGRWQLPLPGWRAPRFSSVYRIEPRVDGLYVQYTSATGDPAATAVARYVAGRWDSFPGRLPDWLVAPDGTWWKIDRQHLLKSTDRGATWTAVYKDLSLDAAAAIDPQGRLYVSADDAILVFQGDHIVERYRFRDLGPDLRYSSVLTPGPGGRMLIGTRGLTIYDGAQWRTLEGPGGGFPYHSISRLAVAGQDVYAVASYDAESRVVRLGVLDLERSQWSEPWPGGTPFMPGALDAIAVDGRERIYLATSDRILHIHDRGQWQQIPLPPEPRHYRPSLTDSLIDARGHYWLATYGLGLYEYDGGSWRVHSTDTRELPDNGVNALALDPQGRLWAATGDGLAVRDVSGVWRTFGPRLSSGEHASWLQDVAVDPQGRAWVVHRQAVAVFNGREWQQFSPSLVGATLWGDALAFDAAGRLWVTVDSTGVAIYRGTPGVSPFAGFPPPPLPTLWTRLRQLVHNVGEPALNLLLLAVALGALVHAAIRRRAPAGQPAHQPPPRSSPSSGTSTSPQG